MSNSDDSRARDRLAVMAGIDVDNPELRRRLDAISARTAERLHQPVSLVSMVLDTAQFFPGSHGLDGWLAELHGTPGEWSFCATAVRTGRAYVVPDATIDPDQATNPLVTVDGVRSYAGVPVIVDGHVMGAHCVLGFDQHTFTPADLAELQDGAAEIGELLQSYRRGDTPA
ncbi:GAF domain-containing protein [Actinoplanes sp. NPDC020271]|uniref:GAF domain-containing protein n=1 Tax=Actinoplanes sp. NPDC020271 TaxID=3363896 RepID=UPI003797371D